METLNGKKVSIVLPSEMSDENKDRILRGAEKLFSRYGIKSITMDEVARQLAISKKTLYQFFPNKDELVYQVAERHLIEDSKRWIENQDVTNSALEEVIGMSMCLRREMSEMHPAMVFDLQRMYPRAWGLFEGQKTELFYKSIKRNLERGIREGHYRDTLDLDLMARLRFELIKVSFDPEVFPPEMFPLAYLHGQLLEHFVRGLLTESGLHEWNLLLADKEAIESIEKKINTLYLK